MQALLIRGLVKTYANGYTAVRGIDLDVLEGDFFALLGPNGAGKSTTIGIVCSLINKTAGEIHVFGHDLDTDKAAAKACIGLVPQEFNFNVFEPVEEVIVNQASYYGIGRRLAFERAEHYLKQLGLWEHRRSMARNLSGGLKRRLMIARALVHQPRLLILDEPTAGVDIELRRSMWAFLREINARGTTIILTTHYLEEAEQLCRNIAIIDHGQIVEHSAMRTLLDKLHTETFILYPRHPVSNLPELPGLNLRATADQALELDITHDQDLNSAFGILSANGIEIVSMRNKTNRLEELFLRLVEHK
jgi:ABC-2 type transport system ATP-binding protein